MGSSDLSGEHPGQLHLAEGTITIGQGCRVSAFSAPICVLSRCEWILQADAVCGLVVTSLRCSALGHMDSMCVRVFVFVLLLQVESFAMPSATKPSILVGGPDGSPAATLIFS